MRKQETPAICQHCNEPIKACNLARHEASCLFPRTLERLFEIGNVDTSGESCWEWRGTSFDGRYGRVNGVGAHRLSLELSGITLEKLHALHTCDNPPCVRPDHLMAGTHAENMQQMYDRGLIDLEARNAKVGIARKAYLDSHPEALAILQQQARTVFIGRKHTEETKQKMSETRKGRTLTPEHCRKISETKQAQKRAREKSVQTDEDGV